MFCPKCGCEYREGFSECADCGVDLVAESPEAEEAEEAEDIDFVTVYRVGNPAIIALAKSILQSAGIGPGAGSTGRLVWLAGALDAQPHVAPAHAGWGCV